MFLLAILGSLSSDFLFSLSLPLILLHFISFVLPCLLHFPCFVPFRNILLFHNTLCAFISTSVTLVYSALFCFLVSCSIVNCFHAFHCYSLLYCILFNSVLFHVMFCTALICSVLFYNAPALTRVRLVCKVEKKCPDVEHTQEKLQLS